MKYKAVLRRFEFIGINFPSKNKKLVLQAYSGFIDDYIDTVYVLLAKYNLCILDNM